MAQEAAVPRGWKAIVQKMIDTSIAAALRAPLGSLAVTGKSGIRVSNGGRLRAEYPDDVGGGAAFYVGDLVDANTGEYVGTGVLVQAPDGTDMMTMRTDVKFGTTMQNIYDSGGRIIFGNDASSGQGIARPWLSGGFSRARYTDMSVTTTSATLETLWDARVTKQSPRLEVCYRATMDTSGTTGETQVFVNGVALAPVTTESFVLATHYVGPAAVAGEHLSDLYIEIKGRRTSATGALRVEPLYWKNKQS